MGVLQFSTGWKRHVSRKGQSPVSFKKSQNCVYIGPTVTLPEEGNLPWQLQGFRWERRQGVVWDRDRSPNPAPRCAVSTASSHLWYLSIAHLIIEQTNDKAVQNSFISISVSPSCWNSLTLQPESNSQESWHFRFLKDKIQTISTIAAVKQWPSCKFKEFFVKSYLKIANVFSDLRLDTTAKVMLETALNFKHVQQQTVLLHVVSCCRWLTVLCCPPKGIDPRVVPLVDNSSVTQERLDHRNVSCVIDALKLK